MALLLRKEGITKVKPLAGGLPAWRDLGFPTLAAGPRGGTPGEN